MCVPVDLHSRAPLRRCVGAGGAGRGTRSSALRRGGGYLLSSPAPCPEGVGDAGLSPPCCALAEPAPLLGCCQREFPVNSEAQDLSNEVGAADR